MSRKGLKGVLKNTLKYFLLFYLMSHTLKNKTNLVHLDRCSFKIICGTSLFIYINITYTYVRHISMQVQQLK